MSLYRCLFLSLVAVAVSVAARAQSTVPTLTSALPAQTLSVGGSAVTIDLKNYFSLPGVTGQITQFDTVLGKFNVELFGNDAPVTVANFLTYVNSGAYTATMIHRSTSLAGDGKSNWIVQGGGFTFTDVVAGPAAIPTSAPIALEYKLPNAVGTLAMARGTATNSATSQWFFNVGDNTDVLAPNSTSVPPTFGYAVFGRVLGTGMTVVNAISLVPTYNAGSPFDTIPLQNVTSTQTSIALSNVIFVNSIKTIPLYPTTNTDPAVFAFNAVNNNGNAATVSITGSTLTITPLAAGTATISVRAADSDGNFTSSTIAVTVAATNSAPVITTQPVSQNVATGSTAVFNVAATGVPTPTYQWQFNGADINGATGARLVLPAGTAQAGTYRVVIKNSVSTVTSTNAALAFTSTTDVGRLSNLSVLTDLTAGDPSFTLGTVLGGGTDATKPLLIRAVGPSLTGFGYAAADVVSDPTMQVFSGQTVLLENDNWKGDAILASNFVRLGAFRFSDSASKDAAVYSDTLAASNASYTVTVKGVGGATGKVLAEIYDGSVAGTFVPGKTPRLLDVSVLKNIAPGGSVTAGFVIGGSTARTVLVRAIGPGLASLGVTSGTLSDPFVELFDGASKKILDNDNWGGDPQITAANTSVGAFAIGDLASKDAIMLVTLTPGNYTARVTGVGSAAGLAVVEVYDVP